MKSNLGLQPSKKTYVQSSELLNQLLHKCEWGIQIYQLNKLSFIAL